MLEQRVIHKRTWLRNDRLCGHVTRFAAACLGRCGEEKRTRGEGELGALAEAPVCEVFNSHEWAAFKGSIVEAAARTCVQKVICACCGVTMDLRTCWWTPGVRQEVKLKKRRPFRLTWSQLRWFRHPE